MPRSQEERLRILPPTLTPLSRETSTYSFVRVPTLVQLDVSNIPADDWSHRDVQLLAGLYKGLADGRIQRVFPSHLAVDKCSYVNGKALEMPTLEGLRRFPSDVLLLLSQRPQA